MSARQDLERAARDWLAEDPDPQTRAELHDILARGDRAALDDRFRDRLAFGTAGMRGQLGAGPNRMNRATVMRASAGLAAYLNARGGRSAVVGYDARHRSGSFARDAAEVLAGAGLRVSLLPRALPTPLLAFAVRHLDADAGVMITASHNPPGDNGYKVYLGDGAQLVSPADAEVAALIDAVGPLRDVPRDDRVETAGERVIDAYLDAICGLPLGAPADRAAGPTIGYTPLHGVGRDVTLRAFARAGFPQPFVVPRQADPDPDFPTVAFPNPEEPGAMDLALAAGAERGADLVLAHDPDADRCAVAVPDGKGFRVLTGDELGCLLGEHVLRHTSGPDRLVVSTIVSSSLLGRIAEDYGARHTATLTGFKWIVRATGGRFVYGYEEALGYCVAGDGPPPVRDKDGISAALVVAAIAASARRDGRTLPDLLDDQARRYGVHATRQVSIRFADPTGAVAAMSAWRAEPPAMLGGRRVEAAEDLLAVAAGTPAARLPPTDALRYRVAGGARVVLRPSGTEPKLKAYLEVVEPATGGLTAARARSDAVLGALRRDILARGGGR